MKFSERLFLFIVLILVIVVRLKYADAALERDEGEYAYAGWQILKGGLPYADFYNMKLPGVYFAYSLIIKLLGSSVAVIRWALILINLLSAFFIFKIAERFGGGFMAASMFLLMSVSYEAQGVIANSEHFVVLFFTASLFFIENKGKIGVIVAGALLAISFLMKQHAVFFILIAILNIWKNHFEKSRPRVFLYTTLLFSIGYAIPLSIWGFWATQKDILDKAYFLTFEYAAAYSSILSPSLKYISNFKFIFFDNIGFWLIFFTSTYYISSVKKRLQFGFSNYREGHYLTVGFFISFLAICPGWHFRPHYFQLIFPFAALVTDLGWHSFKYEIDFKTIKIPQKSLLWVCLALTLMVQFNYFFSFNSEKLMRNLYPNEFFNETKALGQILKKELKPTDKIGIYGNEPQLWYYTQTRAASGFIYAYPLVETQPFALKMTNLYIHEMETTHPNWLIYSNISKGESNKETLLKLETWFKGFSREYKIRGAMYQKSKDTGEIEWNITNVDSSRKPLMLIYERF